MFTLSCCHETRISNVNQKKDDKINIKSEPRIIVKIYRAHYCTEEGLGQGLKSCRYCLVDMFVQSFDHRIFISVLICLILGM